MAIAIRWFKYLFFVVKNRIAEKKVCLVDSGMSQISDTDEIKPPSFQSWSRARMQPSTAPSDML